MKPQLTFGFVRETRPILAPLSAIGGRVAVSPATRHMLVSGGGRLIAGCPSVSRAFPQ